MGRAGSAVSSRASARRDPRRIVPRATGRPSGETAGAELSVLHVTPYYAPAWAFGGVPRAVTDLACAQVAAGHRVTVLTTGVLDATTRIPAREEVRDGVRIVRARILSLDWSPHRSGVDESDEVIDAPGDVLGLNHDSA